MKKIPFVTREQVEEIARSYPTPFYLYDEAGIRRNAQAVRDAFAWNPGFREYFAVKATPNPYLMDILKEYDCGFDCSSEAELKLSEAVGADGPHIMFSSNETPAHEYEVALKLGAIINLDDITHIPFLEKIILCLLEQGYGYDESGMKLVPGGRVPEEGKVFPKKMSCRYNPGGVFRMSNGIMDNPGDSKYGFTKEQLFEGFRILKERGVEDFGIHAFLASNTVTNEYYPTLASQLFALAVELHRDVEVHMAFVNLSGGVGVAYKPEAKSNDIAEIGAGVHRVYEEIFAPEGMDDVAIYTEMGRFMMAPYGALITKVIHEKHIYKEYIGVDACAANLMRPAMYGAYHHITVLGKENELRDHKYDIAGSLCENNDKFAIDRILPEVEKGDYLFIHDAGAHGFAMGYNYNGRLWSAELLLREDGSVKLIRRAQTLRDYFATFDGSPYFDRIDFEG